MTYFLLDLASCTTVHAALGSARTVCGSHLMRGSQPFSKTGHITLSLPLSGVLCLESVMSDKMCVCVCVCVHRQFSSLLTYLCPSLPVEHRPSTTPPPPSPSAIALCSGLLLSFRTSWSPAVSALLQCLASNCCEAGLSSSSLAGTASVA